MAQLSFMVSSACSSALCGSSTGPVTSSLMLKSICDTSPFSSRAKDMDISARRPSSVGIWRMAYCMDALESVVV